MTASVLTALLGWCALAGGIALLVADLAYHALRAVA